MKIFNLAYLLLFPWLFSSPISNTQQKQTRPAPVNIVFQSADGGQTWKDISEGLPENLQADAIQSDCVFANETGLYLRTGDGTYYFKRNSAAPFWTKEGFPNKKGSMAPGKNGMIEPSQDSVFNGWNNGSIAPGKNRITEPAQDSVFNGANNGLFTSTNVGTKWKKVLAEGSVVNWVESGGVRMATSQQGIIRSTDEGKHWDVVISEGGVGIAIARIKGGFAAITFNTASNTRRMRTTYDGGKTWQAIDAGLPENLSVTSIVEAGDKFFCGHPAGIFSSSDKGKTWKLLLPSKEDKAFILVVSGNLIYAVQGNGGC